MKGPLGSLVATAQDWPLVPLGSPGVRNIPPQPAAPEPVAAISAPPLPPALSAPARLLNLPPAPLEPKAKLAAIAAAARVDEPSLLFGGYAVDGVDLDAYGRKSRLKLFIGLTFTALAIALTVVLLASR